MSTEENTEKPVKKTVEVSLKALKKLVDEGKSKDEIGEVFGLTPLQMSALLKDAGLKTKRKVIPAFKLVIDDVTSEVLGTEETVVEAKPVKVKAVKAIPETSEVDPDLLSVKAKVEETETGEDW